MSLFSCIPVTSHIFKRIHDYKEGDFAPNFMYKDKETITLAKKNNLLQKKICSHYINLATYLVKCINDPDIHKTCVAILGTPQIRKSSFMAFLLGLLLQECPSIMTYYILSENHSASTHDFEKPMLSKRLVKIIMDINKIVAETKKEQGEWATITRLYPPQRSGWLVRTVWEPSRKQMHPHPAWCNMPQILSFTSEEFIHHKIPTQTSRWNCVCWPFWNGNWKLPSTKQVKSRSQWQQSLWSWAQTRMGLLQWSSHWQGMTASRMKCIICP